MLRYSENLSGRFLVNLPFEGEPLEQVFFICKHDQSGALGFLINQPFENISFCDLVKQSEGIGLDAYTFEENIAPVYWGGEDNSGQGFVLHSSDYQLEDNTFFVGDVCGVTSNGDILRALLQEEHVPEKYMILLGSMTWQPNELEHDIFQKNLLPFTASSSFLFDVAPENKWSYALKNLGLYEERILSSCHKEYAF